MGDSSMATSTSRALSPDAASPSPDMKNAHRQSMQSISRESSASPELSQDPDSKPSQPIQKRRRVTRACDECRRKKIKCDGKQPCTHCTVYSYECTYDQPSNRRRNPAPQYIEALEQRLQKAEAILRAVLPGLDMDDPRFDAHGVDQLVEASRAANANSNDHREDDAQMQSMVDQAGTLDLDDTGHWDFHGQSSGYMFMRRFRAKFGDSLIPIPRGPERRTLNSVVESPRSFQSSPFDQNGALVTDLPTREVALAYCKSALDDCCALSRPLHKPTFYKRLHSLYDTDSEQWTTEHMRFLPLLYIVMALGCLFTPDFVDDGPNSKGYQEGIDQGYLFFNACKSVVDITDCRDLLSIQIVTFMILFLQGSAKLATCYSYIGIALRACCRLGMHRKVNTNFNTIEQEERKRIFWLVRKLDGYVGTMLGLPHMLSEEDVDQELPAETNDDYIREDGILPMPPDVFPFMKATNAHTNLMMILKKVLKYVYPLKTSTPLQPGQTYTIGHSRIRELERDLQVWMDQLPMELRPSEGADPELMRIQQLLRMSYAYVQMMMYRPFLHYVSPTCQTGRTDKRSFACAAACVSVARNVVHITSEMRRRNLLGGSYWFVMYITYFAILALIYFVLENPDSTTSKDILKDAREGRETLASLAKKSMAADRASMSLNNLFEELPEKLKERRTSLQSTPTASRKRPQPIADPANFPGNLTMPRSVPSSFQDSNFAPHRARSIPSDHVSRNIKKNSLTTSPTASVSSFSVGQSVNSGNYGTPNGTPSLGPFDWSAPQIQQGNLPDLKNVMFPSDNPFAYGNQPISMLEDSQFGGLQETPVDQFSHNSGNQFQPATMSHQGARQSQVNMPSFGGFNNLNGASEMPQQQQQRPQQQRNNFSTSMSDSIGTNGSTPTTNFGLSGTLVNEPDSMQSLGHQPGQEAEDYWSQAPGRGQFRTGFTPGGPAVNLDELFGGGNGWGPVNMGMDLNMGFTNNPNHSQMGNAWSENNGNSNWQ